MRALLDINVVTALLDPDHTFHDRAHAWWAGNMKNGWASCPLTENGVVRIMANPGYSKRTQFRPGELIDSLCIFAGQSDHEFWSDTVSLRDTSVFRKERIHSSRQI